uniref:Uncharacterized protein n=1 Tax=Triticum urartu TaxID=4572 RepID=A0A8R7K2W3_TRIUA
MESDLMEVNDMSMCEKNGQTPPPMPVIAPAGTRNSRQASTDPSLSTTDATGPTPTPTPP